MSERTSPSSSSPTYVVVGGVAGGMSAAARLRRLNEAAHIIVFERGRFVSFANCGLPYFVGGEIEAEGDLLLQTPASLRASLNLDVRVGHEVVGLDAARRVVMVRTPGVMPQSPDSPLTASDASLQLPNAISLTSDPTGQARDSVGQNPDAIQEVAYDALILAPGAQPSHPSIPGLDHPSVHTLRTITDAVALRDAATGRARRAVVLGAGFIGLEAAESLVERGLDLSIVEYAPHVLPPLEKELAWLVAQELRRLGVNLYEGTAAQEITSSETGSGVMNPNVADHAQITSSGTDPGQADWSDVPSGHAADSGSPHAQSTGESDMDAQSADGADFQAQSTGEPDMDAQSADGADFHAQSTGEPDTDAQSADEADSQARSAEGADSQAPSPREAGSVIVHLSDGREIPADLVVSALGITPDTAVFEAAGVDCRRGYIVVDEHGRTNLPHVYAVGDATLARDGVTGTSHPVPLAGPANRAGRYVADALHADALHEDELHADALHEDELHADALHEDELHADALRADQAPSDASALPNTHTIVPRPLPPLLSTAIVRVGRLTTALTGANRASLEAAGMDYATIHVHPMSHAGYYPGAKQMHVIVHIDPTSGRILGAQGVGEDGVDKRVDMLATAIRAGVAAPDLIDLDLAYSPPYGSAKDPVTMVGFVADNLMTGQTRLWYPDQLVWARSPETLLLDVRTPEEFATGHLPEAHNVPHTQLRERIAEVRQLAGGREVAVMCQSGVRSYIAHCILVAAGFESATLSGGMLTLRAWLGADADTVLV